MAILDDKGKISVCEYRLALIDCSVMSYLTGVGGVSCPHPLVYSNEQTDTPSWHDHHPIIYRKFRTTKGAQGTKISLLLGGSPPGYKNKYLKLINEPKHNTKGSFCHSLWVLLRAFKFSALFLICSSGLFVSDSVSSSFFVSALSAGADLEGWHRVAPHATLCHVFCVISNPFC